MDKKLSNRHNALAPRPKKKRRGRRRKTKQKLVTTETWPTTDVGLTIVKFSGCTCCGYFLTAYRSAFGLEWLTDVVEQAEHNWLDLGWHPRLPSLLVRSYDLYVDGRPSFLEFCCEECHRILLIEQIEATQEDSLPENSENTKTGDSDLSDTPTHDQINLAIQIMPE